MQTKRVQFYKFEAADPNVGFEPTKAFANVKALSAQDWIQDIDGMNIGVIVDRKGGNKTSRLRLIRVRDTTPFLLSNARQMSPVRLRKNEKVAEYTQVVLWPADKLIAAVTSRDAPSHKRLSDYVSRSVGEHMHIFSLFEPDMVERLKSLNKNGLRSIKTRIANSRSTQLSLANNRPQIRNIFHAGGETEAAQFGFELSMGRKHGTLDKPIGDEVIALANNLELLEQLVVTGYDDDKKLVTINLKNERISAEVALPSGASDNSFYQAIEKSRGIVEHCIGGFDKAATGL